MEARDQRDDALRCVRLDTRRLNLALREIHVSTIELAELGDPRSRKNQRRDNGHPGDVVTTALGPFDPQFATPNLPNQRIRHRILARAVRSRPV